MSEPHSNLWHLREATSGELLLPLTEGEAAQLVGNVKIAKEFALQDSPHH